MCFTYESEEFDKGMSAKINRHENVEKWEEGKETLKANLIKASHLQYLQSL